MDSERKLGSTYINPVPRGLPETQLDMILSLVWKHYWKFEPITIGNKKTLFMEQEKNFWQLENWLIIWIHCQKFSKNVFKKAKLIKFTAKWRDESKYVFWDVLSSKTICPKTASRSSKLSSCMPKYCPIWPKQLSKLSKNSIQIVNNIFVSM